MECHVFHLVRSLFSEAVHLYPYLGFHLVTPLFIFRCHWLQLASVSSLCLYFFLKSIFEHCLKNCYKIIPLSTTHSRLLFHSACYLFFCAFRCYLVFRHPSLLHCAASDSETWILSNSWANHPPFCPIPWFCSLCSAVFHALPFVLFVRNAWNIISNVT
jgi:hypothetical protein